MTFYLDVLLRRLSPTPSMYRSANRTHIPLWRVSRAPLSLAKRRLIRAEFFSLSDSGYTLDSCSLARSASNRRARGPTLAPREPGNPNASLACHRWVVCDDDDRVPRDCNKNKRPRSGRIRAVFIL